MGNQQAIVPPGGRRTTSPYSPGIRAGDFIFVSGCVPVSSSGSVVGDDVMAQTDAVLANIRQILEAAGGSLADVIRTTVYLTDINTFADMNEAYRRSFPGILPTRTTIEVSRLAKTEYRIEIDAIAFAPQ